MKIKYLLILYILIYHSSTAQTNVDRKYRTYNIQVTYQFDYQPDSLDKSSHKSEQMLLLINDNYSTFESKNHYLADSLDMYPFMSTDINSVLQYLTTIPTDMTYSVYKDSMGQITFVDKIDLAKYQYTEPKNNLSWEISDDTAMINGFACQKATIIYGGRSWTAWFTPQIAISDGPYKFCNLPGLIIKINDSQNYFTFLMTAFVKKTGTIFTSAKIPIAIDKKKFLSSMDYFKKNQFELFKLRARNMVGGEGMKANAEEKNRKNNNSIERMPIIE